MKRALAHGKFLPRKSVWCALASLLGAMQHSAGQSTGAIFVAIAARPILAIHAGTIVEVTGVSDPGDYGPVVAQPSVPLSVKVTL